MVDTARLVARVETKGVTKATSELDKFADEAKEAEDSTIGLGKAAKFAGALALKAGVAFGTAATAMAVLALKSADAQREWQTLSNIAGSSVEDFKAAAFAADQVGISAEKLADISKDTREKLGEFVATGGGGFKDFFEEVAPQVGITAEELQKLSGPEILGRVKSAMDSVNVSLDQQSFFLESIASDTTNLIPLLANEGAELKRLSDAYSALNDQLALTGNQEQALVNLAGSFDLLTQTAGNAVNLISSTLAPTFNEFFGSVAESVPNATQALVDFFNTFIAAENLSSIKAVEDRLTSVNAEIAELEGQNLSGGGRSGGGKRTRLAKLRDESREATERLKELQAELKRLDDAQRTGGVSISSGFQSEASLKTEEDAIAESLERRKNLQREFEDSELTAEQDYLLRREQAVSETFSNLATLTAAGNAKIFRIGQAAALANAFINISEGVTEALSLGPILGPALAASIAVAGGVQIAAISSQKPPSARQQGGQFGAGQDLLVGEKGPELVRFGSGGRISNANETAGMNGSAPIQVKIVNQTTGRIDSADATLSRGEVVVIVREVVNQDIMQPNSQFNKGIDATRQAQRIR